MKFDWDEEKNLLNYTKHKIWFEEAQSVWADEYAVEFFDDEHSDHEERFLRLGHSVGRNILLVVFCERNDGEIIRLISPRKATRKEKDNYEKGI